MLSITFQVLVSNTVNELLYDSCNVVENTAQDTLASEAKLSGVNHHVQAAGLSHLVES